ncbi:alpha/beta hydrolase family esterase [Dinghuibacter silviterrae]|uniref:Polyhydroxybutyrate depolymerase n=1 Tax=Dinghuibacter silviterrae TaxID=1539049 RepID=A0A4R8DHY5_9BACT|nr:PHB depolymerase family esterase [Dinghuibacter silviterrae]TDW96756.1 polyhydroxybutyrate depolymerase [Dinghuibacter silviterrae]
MRFCYTILALFLALQGGAQNAVHLGTRDFLVYVPKRITSGAHPLILVLHGRLGTGSGMVRLADFRPIADREGVILVYPDGIDRSWNDGRTSSPAYKKGVDDVDFINRTIDYMAAHYPVDSTRVYVTGMSNGGFMTSRLGDELTKRIAAIAVVAASVDKDEKPATIPLPVLYLQGTKDPLVPFKGGAIRGGTILSHQETLDRWVAIDGCDPAPVVVTRPDSAHDGTTITKQTYTNRQTGIQVVGITVEDGGHTWPGGWPYLPKAIIGITSRNLDANEAIWEFFRLFRRVSSPKGATGVLPEGP